ncbi:MAG: acyltransferase [Rhizobium sp.]
MQSLRAVAALLVLFYHVSDGRFDAGGAGVDMFFLISGFIMGTIGAKERPRSFLIKRLVRIAPLYWLITLAMCLASVVGLLGTFSFDLRRLALSLLFVPHFDPSGHIWPLFVPGWTLNIEMLFYGVFAVALLSARPLLIATLLLCALVVLGLHDWQAPVLRQWTTPMLLEFIFGLGISQCRHRLPAKLAVAGLLLGIALLAASAFATIDLTPYRVVVWGLPAGLLLAGCIGLEDAGFWPQRLLKPLERLGDASYSLYLTHGIVLAAMLKFLPMGGRLTSIIAVAVALATAQLSFILLERPLGRLGAGRRPGKLRDKPTSVLPRSTGS